MKKQKVIIKRCIIIILLILMFTANPTIVKPSGSAVIDAGSIIEGAEDFLSAGEGENTPLDEADFKEVSSVIYNVLLILGIIAAVIVGLIIGIKMMMGSSTQKAETKELLIPYVVGCVIIFGAFGIWKLVVNMLNQAQ